MSERDGTPKIYRPRQRVPGRQTIQKSEEAFISRVLASRLRCAAAEGVEWEAESLELEVRKGRRATLENRIRNWKPEMGPMGHTEAFLAYYIVGKGLEIGGGW